MRVFISADIEGIAGVTGREQCRAGSVEYPLARALMEQEINAAIEGAFAGGASEVVAADSHGAMENLRADRIDPRARLLQGKPRPLSMAEGLQQQPFDGMMFICYHSAAGEFGVLAHTINGRAFYRVTINGEVMAESDIYAALGAELKTPLWLVSGDDMLQRWIARYYPFVGYACVKRTISQNAAESLSPAQAQAVIRQAAERAVREGGGTLASRIAPPYRLEVMVARPALADLFCLVPGVGRSDALTVHYTREDMASLVGLLSAFSVLATGQG